MKEKIISKAKINKFWVKVTIDNFDNSHQLKISTNGHQWMYIKFDKNKAQAVIDCLTDYIAKKDIK